MRRSKGSAETSGDARVGLWPLVYEVECLAVT